MTLKTIRIAALASFFAAGSALAQLVVPPPAPVLQAERLAPMRDLASFPAVYGASEGVAPADPLALDLYRSDPKLHIGVAFSSYLGIEATLTNPNYVQRLTYVGGGPRLAQGVVLGAGGYDFVLAPRLTVPIDDRLSAFGKLGVAASERVHRQDTITDIGPAASVGTTYKLKNGQTVTAEIPLSPIERKAISGSTAGYGARLKVGF
jgi:hypothetical protein